MQVKFSLQTGAQCFIRALFRGKVYIDLAGTVVKMANNRHLTRECLIAVWSRDAHVVDRNSAARSESGAGSGTHTANGYSATQASPTCSAVICAERDSRSSQEPLCWDIARSVPWRVSKDDEKS